MLIGNGLPFLLLIPGFILAMYAQYKVMSTFARYSRVRSSRGVTGAEAAKEILRNAGVNDVAVEPFRGNLTDHYDPRVKKLRLSQNVYYSDSLAALGVAAHEAGHAVQHARQYSPLMARNAIVPVVSVASRAWVFFLLAGVLFAALRPMAFVGVAVFGVAVLFSLLTLPVELNASKRAIALLTQHGIVTEAEKEPARQVLNAAALTYVAALVMALLQMLYWLSIALSLGGRRRS